jgi:transposase InsO family protein
MVTRARFWRRFRRSTEFCQSGIHIQRAVNQVFALDTTYVPMAQGFVYLTAVIDWASRRVLAYRVAITMEAEHAVAALEEAFAKY